MPGTHLSLTSLPLGPARPLPASPYTRAAASLTYHVHSGVQDVEQWHGQALARRGFIPAGQGFMGNRRNHVTQGFLKFTAGEVTLVLTCWSQGPVDTLYTFWATDVLKPHRPDSSLIPCDIERMTGIIRLGGASLGLGQRKVEVLAVNITGPCADLVRAINTLSSVKDFQGGPNFTRGAQLTFFPHAGPPVVVIIKDRHSVAVGDVTLFDEPGAQIWPTLIRCIESS